MQESAAQQQDRRELTVEKISTVEALIKGMSQQLKEIAPHTMDFNGIEELSKG